MAKKLNQVLMQPEDKYNRELVGHVHPEDWETPQPDGVYNLVVIGAGTAGLVTAAGAAGLGAKVALIERHLMGGDCLNVGCVPSKAIIRSGRVAEVVRSAGDYGINAKLKEQDFGAVMERMRKLRTGIAHHDSAERFQELGVEVFLGDAAFSDSHTITVGDRTLHFKRAVIATGARASAPSIDGLDDVEYLTNETLFSLTELPKRFGIIGAGPIGCEMAQTFARLGSEVILIEAAHGVLPKEERDAADIVQKALEQDGVKILCCGKNMKIAKNAKDKGIQLHVKSHNDAHEETVDQLLVAVGRAPNVEDLNLEAAGVEYDKKGVQVNAKLQTTNKRIFACGDVCSAYQFTHAADFMARIVIQNALFHGRKKVDDLIIPWATYTEPELAHVGLTPEGAKKADIQCDSHTVAMDTVDRAILDGETEGFVRIHTKKGTDKIIGATVVAAHAGDLIGEITLAMQNRVGLGGIANAIHPYPTQAEAVRRVGDAYNRTKLTPTIKTLFEKWLAWQRR